MFNWLFCALNRCFCAYLCFDVRVLLLLLFLVVFMGVLVLLATPQGRNLLKSAIFVYLYKPTEGFREEDV